MPGSTRILAIDQGTTSTRAVMFDSRGIPLAVAQKPLRQIFPKDGWVEHDPEDIWKAVVEVCRTVIAQTGGSDDILAIGITNQRETTIVWDRKTGQAVMNAIVWQDRRGAARCAELESKGQGPVIQNKTGLLLDSYFSATKVEWILNHVEGAKAKAASGDLAFGTIDAFLIWRLTGGQVHATDATNASRSMLFNIRKGTWDDELLEIFGVPASMLPEVRDTAGQFGTTQKEILGSEIQICSAVGDQQGALVGQACFKPGMIKSTYGTGCFVLANTGQDAPTSRHKMLTTIAYRIGGQTTYALEGSIFNAGTVIQWLRDNMKMIETAADSERLARALDGTEAAGKVFLVPAFTGLGAPHWDSEARAAIFGLTRDSTTAQIVRAGLESVAYQTYDLLNALLRDGIPQPPALRVDGGMVVNNWLMQFLADICDIPVERPSYAETTVLGAAFLAGLGSGFFKSLSEIEAAWRLDFRASPQMTTSLRNQLLTGWNDAVRRVRT